MFNRISVWSQNHLGTSAIGYGKDNDDTDYNFKKWLIVVDSPDRELSLKNRAITNDYPEDSLIILDGKYILTTATTADVHEEELALNGLQKTWMNYPLKQCVKTQRYKPDYSKTINMLTLDLKYRDIHHYESIVSPFDVDKLSKSFRQQFHTQVLQPTQLILFDFNSIVFECRIDTISVISIPNDADTEEVDQNDMESTSLKTKGFLTKSSNIYFFSTENEFGGKVPLHDSSVEKLHHKPQLKIPSKFKFDDFAIGGLNDKFSTIFRRALLSRLIPMDMVDRLGIKHTKGILLYGPPGTGKTMIARNIAQLIAQADEKSINVRSKSKYVKVINGPELLSKYVGDSEKNLRDLFLDAEKEKSIRGKNSGLYVIVFDELDSVFKKRGMASSNSSSASDNMVNQLLSKMDGVDQLDNVLIIGITNRVDLLDTALLRPGRFEIQIYIGLPDEDARLEILKFKTHNLNKNKFLDKSVDLKQLARLTSNFSGAEIEGVVKSACSFSLEKIIELSSVVNKNDSDYKTKNNNKKLNATDKMLVKKIKMTQEDFIAGINELKVSFKTTKLGEQLYNDILTNTDNLKSFIMIKEETFQKNLKLARSMISRLLDSKSDENNDSSNLQSVLIHGEAGTGKTLFCMYCCHELTKLNERQKKDEEVCIKMISTSELINVKRDFNQGLDEQNKIDYILQIFKESYQYKRSIIVIDQLEDLIEYVPISGGIYFSNNILQVLKTYMITPPPSHSKNKTLIFTTTRDRSLMARLGISESSHFTNLIPINMIQDIPSLLDILEYEYSDDVLKENIINNLIAKLGDTTLSVSIKQVLNCIQTVKYMKVDDQEEGVMNNEFICDSLVSLLLTDNKKNLED